MTHDEDLNEALDRELAKAKLSRAKTEDDGGVEQADDAKTGGDPPAEPLTPTKLIAVLLGQVDNIEAMTVTILDRGGQVALTQSEMTAERTLYLAEAQRAIVRQQIGL